MTNTQSLLQTLGVCSFLTKKSDLKNDKHLKSVTNFGCLSFFRLKLLVTKNQTVTSSIFESRLQPLLVVQLFSNFHNIVFRGFRKALWVGSQVIFKLSCKLKELPPMEVTKLLNTLYKKIK